MSEAEQTAAEVTEAGPTIEAIAAEVFGTDAPAVPATEVPKEPDPKVEAPPVAEKVSARLTVALRAEERAARSRAEIAAAKAEVDAQRAEVAEQLKTVEALKAAKLSPSKALELLGMSPKEFLESLATEHEPSAVAARAVSATQSETEKLAAEVQALRAEREHERRAIAQQQMMQSSYQAQEAFLEHVVSKAVEYPHLTEEFTPEEIQERGWQVATKHAGAYFKKFGEYPDDSVIADFLETEAKARAEKRTAWRQRIGQKALTPSAGKTPGDLQVAQPATGPSPRTLTSRTASEKATAAKPWSQEWADEESLRILQAALKTG